MPDKSVCFSIMSVGNVQHIQKKGIADHVPFDAGLQPLQDVSIR